MPTRTIKSRDPFDSDYYDRYYGSSRTRVHSAAEVSKLCTAVVSFIEWWQHPLASVLDVGAGIGLWRDWSHHVEGQALNAGHFFPEEAPEQTAHALSGFFVAE